MYLVVNKQITETHVFSASVVFVRVVLTQRLLGVLRSVGILNLAGSAVSPSGGFKHDKRLHFGERYITSFTISAILQIVKVKLTVGCNMYLT
jgi:hypothetical protein